MPLPEILEGLGMALGGAGSLIGALRPEQQAAPAAFPGASRQLPISLPDVQEFYERQATGVSPEYGQLSQLLLAGTSAAPGPAAAPQAPAQYSQADLLRQVEEATRGK